MLEFGNDHAVLGDLAPFTLSINEGEDNMLSIVIAPCKRGKVGEGIEDEENEKVRRLLEKSAPLYCDEEDAYEIIFDLYIMYQVRNESYSSWDDYEIRRGKFLICFERSRLLDHLKDITDCQQLQDGTYYPGAWRHYGVYTENHIIDVITCNEPVIRRKGK